MAKVYSIQDLVFDSFHNGALHYEQEKESINIQGRMCIFDTQTKKCLIKHFFDKLLIFYDLFG